MSVQPPKGLFFPLPLPFPPPMDLQDPPTYKIIPFPAKPLIKPNTRRNVSSSFILTSEGVAWIYETRESK